MGLFDRLTGDNQNSTFTKYEAFAGILIAAAASDGHISDDEIGTINVTVNRMRLYQEQSGSQFSAMIDKLLGILKRQGPNSLLSRSAEALPSALRQTAFAVVADLIFADGSVEDEEKVILESIQNALSISDDLAMKIVEVMEIKNRG